MFKSDDSTAERRRGIGGKKQPSSVPAPTAPKNAEHDLRTGCLRIDRERLKRKRKKFRLAIKIFVVRFAFMFHCVWHPLKLFGPCHLVGEKYLTKRIFRDGYIASRLTDYCEPADRLVEERQEEQEKKNEIVAGPFLCWQAPNPGK